MKTKLFAFVALTTLSSLNPQLSTFAQGTAFTYQGRLNDGVNPANGNYDLRFALFDAFAVGNQVGSPLTNAATSVSNGLFTVTLDFGNQFPGANRWLDIGVRTNGAGSFFPLSPRQALTPAPYAIYAPTAGSANLALSANMLEPAASAGYWNIAGNTGTSPVNNFLGTTDLQALILKVHGQEAQRFEPTTDTPDAIGGYSGNAAGGLPGATIGGGGTAIPYNGQPQPNVITNNGYYGTISGGYNNIVGGYGGVISGGSVNTATGDFSGVGAGQFNNVSGSYSTLVGGMNNTNSGSWCSIGGGARNTCFISSYATIGGGAGNFAAGAYATVPGGSSNSAGADFSFAAGHRAISQNKGSFVWADSQNAGFVSERDDEVRFRCQGGVTFGSGAIGANQYVYWAPGSMTWSFTSDRNLKDRFSSVDAEAILDKVSRLPLAEWSYKGYPQRHIGPMAQDFHALFSLNDDDKALNEGDLHGVTLAAIQGLNQKLQEKNAEIETLKAKAARVDSLEKRLTELEQVVQSLAEKK